MARPARKGKGGGSGGGSGSSDSAADSLVCMCFLSFFSNSGFGMDSARIRYGFGKESSPVSPLPPPPSAGGGKKRLV